MDAMLRAMVITGQTTRTAAAPLWTGGCESNILHRTDAFAGTTSDAVGRSGKGLVTQ